MANLVLLGDSIFDNVSYVGTEPDVISHLRVIIPQDWSAELLAVDGSVVEDVSAQILKIPENSTHLIVSVGGNNALMNADILQMQADSSAEVFNNLADRISNFEANYQQMLENISSKNLPTILCTVYFPNFPEPVFQKISVAALSAFNDAIIRQAISNGLPLLDLRLICNEIDDYANEIEPSGKGGQKIAANILEAVKLHDFSKNRTEIFI